MLDGEDADIMRAGRVYTMSTTTQLQFQRARDIDASVIADMSRQYIEQGLRPAWTAGRVRAAMHRPETFVLAARAAHTGRWPSRETFAGFAIMVFGEETAHLNLLAVAPAFRRRGVARSMLHWLELSAVTAGVFEISLEVRASNRDAAQLYLAQGYVPVQRVAGYYQGVEDAIRMCRDLRALRRSDASAHDPPDRV